MKIRNTTNEPEQWKQFRDTHTYLSDQGRAKIVYKNGSERLCGYPRKTDGQIYIRYSKRKAIKLDRAIWETFKGTCPKGIAIVHKNGLKNDNSIYNLELVSKQELGKRYGYKASKRRILDKDTNKVYRSGRIAAKYLHCSYQCVFDICNDITKKKLFNLWWWDEENEIAYRGKK